MMHAYEAWQQSMTEKRPTFGTSSRQADLFRFKQRQKKSCIWVSMAPAGLEPARALRLSGFKSAFKR